MEFFERLREERKRLKLKGTELAAIGGVSAVSQSNYERGSRVPDGNYLAAIAAAGVDVQYVLTGQRSSEPVLTPGEKELVAAWRQAGDPGRAAALAALRAGRSDTRGARAINMGDVKNSGKMAVVNGDMNGDLSL